MIQKILYWENFLKMFQNGSIRKVITIKGIFEDFLILPSWKDKKDRKVKKDKKDRLTLSRSDRTLQLVSLFVLRFLENCSKDDFETLHSDSSPICEQTDRAGFSKKNPKFFL